MSNISGEKKYIMEYKNVSRLSLEMTGVITRLQHSKGKTDILNCVIIQKHDTRKAISNPQRTSDLFLKV